MKYSHVMFDLDGTLLNTLEDLADSGNAALEELGLPVHPVECYRYFVGNGVHELMKRLLPPEEINNIELGKTLLSKYTAQYNNRWHSKTRPYDGMVEALNELKAAGATLSVFSNKPDEFTKSCIYHFFGENLFSAVRGGRDDTPRKPAPDGAFAILNQLGVKPESVLYVGDTATDMQTAHAAGFFAIGVTWGFRTREELEENKANAIIDAPSEILNLLERN